MGTEIQNHKKHYQTFEIIKVKLNNPLMGTEMRLYLYAIIKDR